MGKYFDLRNSEIRDIPDSLYGEWIETDNPKRYFWKPLPKKPIIDPEIEKEPVFINKKWVVAIKSQEELDADKRKTWKNSFDFFSEFSDQEQTNIVVSQDDKIAKFRYLLSLRSNEIFSDEIFIINFLGYLVSIDLINQERADLIIKK